MYANKKKITRSENAYMETGLRDLYEMFLKNEAPKINGKLINPLRRCTSGFHDSHHKYRLFLCTELTGRPL
jgi:hypothetical protein